MEEEATGFCFYGMGLLFLIISTIVYLSEFGMKKLQIRQERSYLLGF